jgi:hypothetical protein
MAHNDFHLEEFKLKDPIKGLSDGVKDPIQDKTPGFFQSLRNPIDLIREESLPASLYQWLSGNTKKKQAQEALEYIQNNPDQAGSRVYKEAERKLNRFGYLLDDGPMNIDIKEVGNMIKTNPKLFGAELVNMIVADPWLLFMPLGWGRLGRGVVNSIKVKRGKNLQYKRIKAKNVSDIKVGATATLATPLVFSTTYQLGEKAELDPKRTTVETTIGATAGALFSVGFAGTGELARRLTSVPRARIEAAHRKVFNKYKQEPEKLVDFNENGIYRNVDELIEIIKKETGDIADPKKFEIIKADITSALRTINENGKDMALATALKRGAAIGGVFGAAQFLTVDNEKLLATAKGFGVGAAIYAAGRILGRNIKQIPKEFREAALSGEATLDAAKMSTVKLQSAAQELSNVIKRSIPDAIDSRRKIFYYLTKAQVDRKTFKYNPKLKPIADNELTAAELQGAKTIEKVFDEYYKIFGQEAGLVFNKRTNYLPLLWNEYNPKIQPFRFVKDFDTGVVTGPSAKFQFARRGVFGDINKGLQKNYTIRTGMDDPAELVRIYAFSAGKALSTRAIITNLEQTQISNKPLLIRNNIKKTFDDTNYTEFKHPYFVDKGDSVLIHKGMINSLRMVFDATDEGQLMGALFTTNLMMKRLAVGFSFFHAGALVESLWFAGAKPSFIKKTLDPRSKPEILNSVKDPKAYIKDFDHAVNQLRTAGYDDVVRFGQGAGLQISIPEDTGFDRFYYNIRGLDPFLKRHFGISTQGKVEKVFRWFDAITWDRIFTAAKLHTFLTVLDKPTLMGKPNALRIMPGDTQSVIYGKATKAASFTNDAFGGQNWEQLANRIQNDTLKRLTQTMFAPGSRGYMQLLLFAPDWTLSNIRIIAKSLPAFESDPALRRMYQYYFARAALTYAVAGSALNYIFSGHSILENTDPTRIDLGDGQVLTFSKQLMEPFHWITDPQSTGLKKIGSLPRTTIEVLTNKQYLTTKWSPNLTKKDDEAIEKGLKIGGHVGMRFLPIWLQSASRNIAEGLQEQGLSLDLASDTAVDFVLGQLGHPRYQGPRYTQYKTKGLVRSPYETLF